MRHKKRCALQSESLEGRALLSVAFVDHSPNNSMRHAEILQLDPTDGQASVVGQVSGGDQDVYRFTAPASGSLQLSLSDSGRNPVEVDAFTGAGRVLHTSARHGTASGSISLAAGQDVFFRVRGFGHGVGTYKILLSDPSAVVPVATLTPGTPAPGPGVVPMNPAPTPTPSPAASPTPFMLDAAGNARLTGSIPTAGGSDSYTFTAPRSGRITFGVRRTGSNPLSLTVRDSSGTLLLSLDSDIPSLLAFIPGQQGQTYTLRVTARASGPAPYFVTVSER
jgi:hypothetical protein